MIYNKVKTIIANQIQIDEANIHEATTFSDVNADSLDVVEVLMALEKEFNIIIPDEAVDDLNTVLDLAKFIEKAVNQ